jgi:hypothetical protein
MATTTNKGGAYIRRCRSVVVVFDNGTPGGTGLNVAVINDMGTPDAFRKGL